MTQSQVKAHNTMYRAGKNVRSAASNVAQGAKNVAGTVKSAALGFALGLGIKKQGALPPVTPNVVR